MVQAAAAHGGRSDQIISGGIHRKFIRGIEVDGSWLPDEDGALRHARDNDRWCSLVAGEGLKRGSFTELDAAALDWQVEVDRRSFMAEYSVDEGLIAESAEIVWSLDLDALGEAGASAGVGSTGLVSVLSKDARRLKARRAALSPVVPFAVQAARAEAVQAVGAFVAGGDDARMAKLRMSVGFAARVHGAERRGHRPDDVRMLTLTYRPGFEWGALHVKVLCDRLREWHARQGVPFRYVWVAEIQDGKRRVDGVGRGVIHYHLVMWVPKGTNHLPKPDAVGWWPHGSTRIEVAKHATAYLMHYLKKSNSKNFKEFPDGCRTYSVGGLAHSERRARRWLRLPAFVQANSSIFDRWERVKGGGWCSPDGELIPSEFRRINCGGVWCLQRVHTHSRSIEASGPFEWHDAARVFAQSAAMN